MVALTTDTTDASSAQSGTSGPQVGQAVSLPELSQDERQRRQRIADAWKAYKGDWGIGPLRVAPGEPDDNVRPNRCMPIVDTGVSFLFGEPVKIEIANDGQATSPGKSRRTALALHPAPSSNSDAGNLADANNVDNGAALGTSPAQQYLDDCWGDDDDKMTLLGELAMNGAIAGHAFVMIVPASGFVGEPLPHLTVLNPENVTVITDPHDCKTVQEYWIQYEVQTRDSNGNQQQITYRKVITRQDPDGLASATGLGYDTDDSWLILDYTKRGASGSAWVLTARTEWPKPWPPIVDCQNLPNPNEYYGLPDLPKDLISLNRALIFNESNTNRIIKHYAHPTRWASGVNASQLQTTPDNILLFQSPEAKLQALDAKADLANCMQFAENLRSDMDEQSQVPSVALGRMQELPKGQISGVTIRALYAPIMAKTTKKRRLYGKLIRLVSQYFLELGGFIAASQAKITLHWKDPMPADDLAAAQTAQAWMAIGVSADTLMMQGGYDPDTEAAKTMQENQRSMLLAQQGMAPIASDTPAPPTLNADGTTAQPAPQHRISRQSIIQQRFRHGR